MKAICKFCLVPLLLHALASHAALTVTNVASGNYARHSLFLKSDGSLWAMGENEDGELGNGTFSKNPPPYGTNRPEQIVGSGVASIAAGSSHSLFLKSDSSLWAMGYNLYGQLGDGTFNYTNRPEQIVASGVTAIAAGYGHSLFLKSDGSLWAMGFNDAGQLGDGTFSNTNRPEQIVASGVTAIAGGFEHSLFLKSDGSLWAMGTSISGQLGDGTFNSVTNRPEQIVASGVTAVAAGYGHSLFLKSDGSLWGMGNNYFGELGGGIFNRTNRPVRIVTSGVTAIAAGSFHSMFLKSDGSLWAMGNNYQGQLGDGFDDPFGPATPEQIVPSPPPVLSSALSSNTNLQFDATTLFGGNFRLLGSTNVALPLSQWTPLRTNSITTVRGTNNYSVILTNAVNPGGRQFYILQSQ